MIGDRIRYLRKERNISLCALSKQTGVPHTTIANIETEVSKNPSWYTICKIAAALGVSLDDLQNK